jgi:hypothetical protein
VIEDFAEPIAYLEVTGLFWADSLISMGVELALTV